MGEPRAGFCGFCLKLAFSISTHFHLPDLDKAILSSMVIAIGRGSSLPPEDCITSHNIRHDFNEVGNYLLQKEATSILKDIIIYQPSENLNLW